MSEMLHLIDGSWDKGFKLRHKYVSESEMKWAERHTTCRPGGGPLLAFLLVGLSGPLYEDEDDEQPLWFDMLELLDKLEDADEFRDCEGEVC